MNSDEKGGCGDNGRCIIASKKDIGVDIDVKPLISCRPKMPKRAEVDIDVEFQICPGNVTLALVGEKQTNGCNKICCYKASIDLSIEPKLRHTKPAPTRCEADFDVSFEVQSHCTESNAGCGKEEEDWCHCDKCSGRWGSKY